MSVLVLGVGNVLMMDESLGVRAVDELGRRFRFSGDVELLDGGTSGMELLSHIRNREHLIIIDAIRGGYPPGTVLRVEGEDVSIRFRTRISPHQLGISDLLAAATLTGEMPAGVVLFGIEPKSVDVGLGLSDEVKAGFEKLLGEVVTELRKQGCAAQPVQAATSFGPTMWEGI